MKVSKKTRARHRMILVLDRACRERVFLRDNFSCVRCGSKDNIQWCHVVSRRHLHLRWQDDNSFTGCAGCHIFWHGEPILAIDWFAKSFPERHAMLMKAAPMYAKVNIRELYEALG